jgi:hypothetical protein
VPAAAATHSGQTVAIQFHDDHVGAVIAPGGTTRRKPGRRGPDGPGQGSLF